MEAMLGEVRRPVRCKRDVHRVDDVRLGAMRLLTPEPWIIAVVPPPLIVDSEPRADVPRHLARIVRRLRRRSTTLGCTELLVAAGHREQQGEGHRGTHATF